MGCLKKIFQSVILCFAFIGFLSVGGGDFVKTKWNEFRANHSEKVNVKASKLGDFSKIGEEFEISQSASLFGYNGVIAEHKSSGQKMVIVDTKENVLVSQADINNNQVDDKINALTKKFKYSAIKVENLKMGSKGNMNVYGKTVPYVKFSAKISKIPLGEIDGMISAYKEDNQNKLLIALNQKDKYSQLIAQEFFKNVQK